MSDEIVLHRSTAVHKLILSLREIISKGRAESSYPKWSDCFLSFCEQTAVASLNYLEKKSTAHKTDINDHGIFLSQLSSIMQGWELLHTFIKPVLDADSLRVPHPLVNFLIDHVGELKAVEGAKFAIEVIPDLNYLQHRHTRLKNAMKFLRIVIQGPKILPRLGFLGMPCSQSNSLFMNCILYHEVGHFIAEEAGVFGTKERKKQLDQLKGFFKQYADWAANTILIWMEEIFADIVAAKLLGPAYTLSYIEMLRLVFEINDNQILTFAINHPADALRFREQLKAIKNDGWLEYVKDLSQWQEIEKIAMLEENKYRPPKAPFANDSEMLRIWQKLIKFLCEEKRMKNIHETIDGLISDRKNPFDHFINHKDIIRKCLEHAIVPSVKEKGKDQIPHPTAIINSAVFFWLSGMSDLYKLTEKEISKDKPGNRVFLEKRLEMWCLKAIEDWLTEKTKQTTKK